MGFGGSKTCPQCHKLYLESHFVYCPMCGAPLDNEIPTVEIECPICHGKGKITTNKY